ncbi:kelch-like protein 1 [Platysternon megacephalum]|uniref:Kelch-like protein 1 n=1 Tax=Platysternon megacephalum TaxID=55544 RepID=A0A4D9E6K7_9SAUR|nr:kelch-like protein 1 [Platysternon megacephalum]
MGEPLGPKWEQPQPPNSVSWAMTSPVRETRARQHQAASSGSSRGSASQWAWEPDEEPAAPEPPQPNGCSNINNPLACLARGVRGTPRALGEGSAGRGIRHGRGLALALPLTLPLGEWLRSPLAPLVTVKPLMMRRVSKALA